MFDGFRLLFLILCAFLHLHLSAEVNLNKEQSRAIKSNQVRKTCLKSNEYHLTRMATILFTEKITLLNIILIPAQVCVIITTPQNFANMTLVIEKIEKWQISMKIKRRLLWIT